MIRIPVVSTDVLSLGFSGTTLEVHFKRNDAIYQYHGVPETLYQLLLDATADGQSVGGFLAREVKKQGYKYERVPNEQKTI